MRFITHPLTTLAAAALAACVSAPAMAIPAPLPSSIRAAAHEVHTLSLTAHGVQIYACRQRAADGRHEWTFIAPVADLYDGDGQRVGTHGAGPQWRFSDGSLLTGRVKARAPAPDSEAIPWLLLQARPGALHDRYGTVRSIQRLNTVGGQAPAAGCHAGNVGTDVHVPYSADYHFYSFR